MNPDGSALTGVSFTDLLDVSPGGSSVRALRTTEITYERGHLGRADETGPVSSGIVSAAPVEE